MSDEPERLDPFNRSKIYLQLISFRQQHESEQMAKLNQNVHSLKKMRIEPEQYVTFSNEQESYDIFSAEATLKADDSASLNISKTKLPKFKINKPIP